MNEFLYPSKSNNLKKKNLDTTKPCCGEQILPVPWLNRLFALRGHVTSFFENERYMILPSKND